MSNILISILFGLVEGITEWLPISSTGHMILLEQLVHMNVSQDFWDMYLVVIQLGAIMAVVVLYWNKIWPFPKKEEGPGLTCDRNILKMWLKIIVATIPAVVVGLPFDSWFEAKFYNFQTVAIMLIIFGIAFIVVENLNKDYEPYVDSVDHITYRAALFIGLFQVIAAVFPGTSRSGATILAALMIGISRTASAEFTFYLAIPTMFGASLLKLVKFGNNFAPGEIAVLLVGMVTAFIVSIIAIKFLMDYIKKHNFKVFGWYRIVLGIIVLGYFLLAVN